MPTNTGIFLRALKLCGESRTKQVLLVSKLCGESRTKQVLLVSKKKIGGNHAFFRDDKASIRKKRYTLLCFMRAYPEFSVWISIALAQLCLLFP